MERELAKTIDELNDAKEEVLFLFFLEFTIF